VHVLLFANCITPACRQRRDNARYDAPTGRRKVLLLADYLTALGHQVEIISPSYAKKTDTEFVENIAPGVTVRHAPTRALLGIAPERQKRAANFNYRVVRSHARRGDVLVVSYNYHREYAAALLCAARECGLKTLLEYEDGLFLDKEWQTPEGRAFEKEVYEAASACLVVNAGLEARVREVTAKPPPCFVLPGLPDLRLLARTAATPPGARRLLFAGNFAREHGFAQLCAWAENLPQEMKLDITGQGGPKEIAALQALAAQRSNVRFHGFLPDKEFGKIFSAADACVLVHDAKSPYYRTQFPSKFFDSLSHNKRVASAPDARLAPFLTLPHLIIIEDFPRGLARLPEMLRAASPPDTRAVRALGEDLRRQLGDFLAKI
jgi:hypothetical protein